MSASLVMTGCDKWLDIIPEGQVEASKMYEEEIGYAESLAGIYQSMGSVNTYGVTMITMPDALAQFWLLPTGNEELSYFKNFNYTHSTAEKAIEQLWANNYITIANANLLLSYIDNDPNNGKLNYRIMKGEALGIRAAIHLDLLRLFGPQMSDSTALSIPYRTKFDNVPVPMMSAGQVLRLAEKDLLEAREMLTDDPIKTYGRKNSTLDNYNAKIAENFRGSHMNYYAVTAILARLYMMTGQTDKAKEMAQEVIDAEEVFHLVKPSEMSNNPMMQQEVVFGLYLGSRMLNGLTSAMGGASQGGSDILSVSKSLLDKIFADGEGSMDDFRLTNGWRTAPAGTEGLTTRKYYWPRTDSDIPANDELQQIVPIVRLTEMYLIVAEAESVNHENGKSVAILNSLRKARNLPLLNNADYSQQKLMSLVLAEARRELIAEGQMFYMYKRLNEPIPTAKGQIETHEVKWTLPIPKQELEYNK